MAAHSSDENGDAPRPIDRPPLVFISHDTRDAPLAEAFSKLLSSVSMGVLKSFRSSDKSGAQGIEYGVEWFPEIMRNIENEVSRYGKTDHRGTRSQAGQASNSKTQTASC